MKLNKGCGCLLMGLAAVNLMALIGSIVTLIAGDESTWLALLGLALFGSNLVASMLLGIGALRGVAVMRTRDVTEDMQAEIGQRTVEEDEGEDSDQDSG